MDKVIMGLDLSLSSTGVAVIRGNTLLHSRSIKTESSESWFNRMEKIVESLEELNERYRPSLVFIENYSFDSKFGREIMGEVHGVVKFILSLNNVNNYFRVITPKQLKLFITGNSKALKKDVIMALNTEKGTTFKQSHNDQADAFGIALIGYQLFMAESNLLDIKSLPKHQRTVIETAKETLRGDGKWLNLFN